MIARLLILMGPLLMAAYSHAATDPRSECSQAMDRMLKVLTRTSATVHEGEKRIWGEILKKGEKFPKELPNGFYVYLIDSEGRIAFAPRVPDLHDTVYPVVTHRALTEKLLEARSKDVLQIIGAGEFEVSFGEIAELNNKAGTYHGNQSHLKHAELVFKEAGLPVSDRTLKVDYAIHKASEIHTEEILEARAYQHFSNDPRYREAMMSVERFEKDAYRRYPSKIAGKVDWGAFFTAEHPENKLAKARRAKAPEMNSADDLAIGFISALSKKRDIYNSLQVMLITDHGDTEALKILHSLGEYEGIYGQ